MRKGLRPGRLVAFSNALGRRVYAEIRAVYHGGIVLLDNGKYVDQHQLILVRKGK